MACNEARAAAGRKNSKVAAGTTIHDEEWHDWRADCTERNARRMAQECKDKRLKGRETKRDEHRRRERDRSTESRRRSPTSSAMKSRIGRSASSSVTAQASFSTETG